MTATSVPAALASPRRVQHWKRAHSILGTDNLGIDTAGHQACLWQIPSGGFAFSSHWPGQYIYPEQALEEEKRNGSSMSLNTMTMSLSAKLRITQSDITKKTIMRKIVAKCFTN